MPLLLENDMKFSVSVRYLPNGITHSTQNWHMDTSKKCVGQVRIWSWFNDFWQSYVPFTLKKIWNFQFRFIISSKVLHIQLKIDYGQKANFVMVRCFWQSYAPLTLKKKRKFSVSIPYLPNSCTYSTEIKDMDM
jgi:hypothetical protein